MELVFNKEKKEETEVKRGNIHIEMPLSVRGVKRRCSISVRSEVSGSPVPKIGLQPKLITQVKSKLRTSFSSSSAKLFSYKPSFIQIPKNSSEDAEYPFQMRRDPVQLEGTPSSSKQIGSNQSAQTGSGFLPGSENSVQRMIIDKKICRGSSFRVPSKAELVFVKKPERKVSSILSTLLNAPIKTPMSIDMRVVNQINGLRVPSKSILRSTGDSISFGIKPKIAKRDRDSVETVVQKKKVSFSRNKIVKVYFKDIFDVEKC